MSRTAKGVGDHAATIGNGPVSFRLKTERMRNLAQKFMHFVRGDSFCGGHQISSAAWVG